MKFKLLIILILTLVACKDSSIKKEVASKDLEQASNNETNSIDLKVYDYNGFEKAFLNKKDNTIYVINFWATWCAPCVKELPYFEKLGANYTNENVEVILVSLDFPHLYEKKLKPFIVKKKLKSKVVALDDADMNTWIPKVNKGWSGAIPATIIYKNDTSKFYEQSFTYEELETELKQFLN